MPKKLTLDLPDALSDTVARITVAVGAAGVVASEEQVTLALLLSGAAGMVALGRDGIEGLCLILRRGPEWVAEELRRGAETTMPADVEEAMRVSRVVMRSVVDEGARQDEERSKAS